MIKNEQASDIDCWYVLKKHITAVMMSIKKL